MNTYNIYEGDKLVEIYQAIDSIEVMMYVEEEYFSQGKNVTFNKMGNEESETFLSEDIIRRV